MAGGRVTRRPDALEHRDERGVHADLRHETELGRRQSDRSGFEHGERSDHDALPIHPCEHGDLPFEQRRRKIAIADAADVIRAELPEKHAVVGERRAPRPSADAKAKHRGRAVERAKRLDGHHEAVAGLFRQIELGGAGKSEGRREDD